MRTFFLRELRRQAPVAVASLVLGLLVIALWLLALEGHGRIEEGACAGFIVSVIAAAYLLGIASVAPDAESGAQAFLGTLPLRRSSEVLVRWSVAALLVIVTALLASLAPIYLMRAVILRSDSVSYYAEYGSLLTGVGVAGVIALAAGLLGSVAVRKTLVAFVTAPLVLIALVAAYAWFGSWMDAPTAFETFGAWALVPLVLVAAAAAHLKGDVHRPSFRPLGVVSIVLGGGLVLGLGAITAGRVHAQASAPWRLSINAGAVSHDGRHMILSWHRQHWGAAESRGDLLNLDTGAIDRSFGPGANVTSFNPAGDTVVVLDDAKEWFRVVDLATGKRLSREVRPAQFDGSLDSVQRQPSPYLSVPGTSTPKKTDAVVWQGRTPYYTGWYRALWGGMEKRLPFPAETCSAESAAGSRLILRREDGSRVLWDLGREAGAKATVTDLADAVPIDAKLSPDGRFAVLLVPAGDHSQLRWTDLDAGSRVWKTFPITGAVGRRREPVGWFSPTIFVSFSPSSRKAFVAWEKSRETSDAGEADAVLVDLATNTGRALVLPAGETLVAPTCWSPSETKVLLGPSRVVDFSVPPTGHGVQDLMAWWQRAVAFTDDDHVLTLVNGPEALDLKTLGKVPFEHKR